MRLPVVYTVGGVAITPPLSWLPPEMGIASHLVIAHAHASIGTRERPIGSNRGPEIDTWLRRAKVPESVIQAGDGAWCAAWAGCMWLDSGLDIVPPGFADCDVWMAWAKRTKRWSSKPGLGALVLYGTGGVKPDSRHVGIVADLTEPVLSFEGNTSVEGAYERNGTAVAPKLVTASDPVLGYCHIYPIAA